MLLQSFYMQKYREILIYLIIFCRKCHYNAKSVKKDKVSCTIENKEVPLHRFSRERGKIRGVAQLVAHLVWDQVVARSSRVTPTIILKSKKNATAFGRLQ